MTLIFLNATDLILDRHWNYLHGRATCNFGNNKTSQDVIYWEWYLVARKLYVVVDKPKYAISQLRFVRSGLHLVTYLNVGNFYDKSTETTLHKVCVHVFLRFSDSSKPNQSVSLIYEFVWIAGFRKSEKNLLKTSWKAASMTKVAHIFWWRHDNRK